MDIDKIKNEIQVINSDIIENFNKHNPSEILKHIIESDELIYIEHIQITKGWNTLRDGFMKWHVDYADLSIEPFFKHINILTDDVVVLINAGHIIKSNEIIQKMTWTAVLKKINDQWKIVNSHETVMGIEQ
ncbi:MAG: hypothetical protein JXB49_24410 [Bacteroidales bacterium]|nr:hypothetical protein [Bacteroidales bacterium]